MIWFGCMAGSALCRADLCSDCVLDNFGSLFYIQKRFQGEEVVFGPCRSWFLMLLASWALLRSYPRHTVHPLFLRAGQLLRTLNLERTVALVARRCICFIFWRQKRASKPTSFRAAHYVSITETFLFFAFWKWISLYSQAGCKLGIFLMQSLRCWMMGVLSAWPAWQNTFLS